MRCFQRREWCRGRGREQDAGSPDRAPNSEAARDCQAASGCFETIAYEHHCRTFVMAMIVLHHQDGIHSHEFDRVVLVLIRILVPRRVLSAIGRPPAMKEINHCWHGESRKSKWQLVQRAVEDPGEVSRLIDEVRRRSRGRSARHRRLGRSNVFAHPQMSLVHGF
ncbi:hypothetical protein AK812_SmicGene16662 [Symbiodinium microadriaticum]|uniref:Uncharacterized protein n=1 Tax=Symbiodinium microadriaticum TaxID=2951 RepID=A0A1Q9DZP6_SYMMI|nr:hypothetical protein AK812_SmicGene16662 [Symbiodinium microadriaticum]